ncbi:COG3488 Predicted thiol oxidoreductase [Oxalobacteraceae bacterium]
MRQFMKQSHRHLLLLTLVATTVIVLATANNAMSESESGDCFWNPATKQCTPDDQIFLQPVAELSPTDTVLYEEGLKQFKASWSIFPLIDGEWGLGPTFHASSCVGCHVNGGRGKTVDDASKTSFQQLVRLSLPGTDAYGEPVPHPVYGNQLQVFGIYGESLSNPVVGEADLRIDWEPQKTTLADGTEVELRRPQNRITKLAFGPLGEKTLTSLRNTPVVYGMGYLDAVPEADILALAAMQKSQGLNGRPNYVKDDATGKQLLGRFGWKANQPTLKQQVAAAHIGDMGITSTLYQEQNCPKVQVQCQNAHTTGKHELTDQAWDAVTFFLAGVEVPKRPTPDSDKYIQGEKLFRSAGCTGCHVSELKTGKFPMLKAIENKQFHPYTDLLLHDMGDDLADNRPDFKAGGRDWRTAPLWGVGLSRRVNGSMDLLHDGRARSVLEAILWHGGEAKKARDQFANMKKEDREALISFVHAL